MAIVTRGVIMKDFIAGFLEGDGSIMSRFKHDREGYNYFSPRINFINNNYTILLRIENFLGKGQFYKDKTGTYYLRYEGIKRVRLVLNKLPGIYLSCRRKKQLRKILHILKINFSFGRKITVDWVRGFAFAEGWKSIAKSTVKLKKYQYLYFGLSQKYQDILLKIRALFRKQKIETYLYEDFNHNYKLLINKRVAVKRFILYYRVVV